MTLLEDLGYTCTALPDGDEFAGNFPLIVVNRIGGGCTDGITDRALCAVLVVHNTRPEAWRVAGLVRDRVLSAGCTEVDGVLIDTTDEATGNQEVMDIAPENRMVDSTFWLTFRRQR